MNTWSVDGTVVQTGGTTYTLTDITANHAVNVTFTPLTYTVTPSAGANGTISPSTEQTVNYGSSLTLTATPGTGYTVNTWSLDGTVVQTGGTTYTLADIVTNHSVTVTFTLLTVSAVSLTASPASPQMMNTAITLTATPTDNGGQVQYLFRAGYTNATGWVWTNINGSYTTTATCNWTPALATAFTLVVWAREVGHTANYDAYATIPYQVNATPLTAVALAVKPAAPQPVNTAITLTATPTGGGGRCSTCSAPAIRMPRAGIGRTSTARYTTTATCSWTPTAVESYTLVVWARLIGHTANYDQYATQSYTVTVPPLTAVALSVNPLSPQPVNTAIKLTATPTGGGGQVQYLFRVGYTNASGWVWTNVNGTYTTTASCTWTPTTTGSFTVVVWARLIGHTANYDQYQSLTDLVVTPFTAVALSATPASPQPVNTAIKLTATPTGGGGQVQSSSAWAIQCFRLGVDERQRHLHHHGLLHLDADDHRLLHGSGVGAPGEPYRQLRSIPVTRLSGHLRRPPLTAVALAVTPPRRNRPGRPSS